jgi:hypothetical protein
MAYRRRPGSLGVRIGSPAAFASAPLNRLDPAGVVLSIVVRPDAYAAFRALREQAWTQGYAVNWIPLGQDEPIVLVPSKNAFEQ